MNTLFVIESESPERTREIGFRLAELVREGDVIALTGPLGAGKTTFAQGLLSGLGVKGYVTSPSFTIANEYEGRVKVAHLDLYRIDRLEELKEIGLDEYLGGDYLVVMEWADRVEPHLSGEYLKVNLEMVYSDDGFVLHRRISFEPRGSRFERIVTELGSRCL